MARRSAPPNSGPAYIPHPSTQPPRRALHDPHESALARFMREQLWAPEKIPGNISIVTGVGMFVAGIVVARRWGELMVPA